MGCRDDGYQGAYSEVRARRYLYQMRPYTEEPGAEQFACPVLDWRRGGRTLRRPYGSCSMVVVHDLQDAELEQAKHYLAGVAQSEHLVGIRTDTEALSGAAALTILDVAHRQHVDLIVMCSHGHTGFKRWMLGSVAQQVARHSSAPV